MTPYDDAMKIVSEIVQSQMMWRSERMLALDLKRATRALAPVSPARLTPEQFYEAIGGDLCVCQRLEHPSWCEACQARLAYIGTVFAQLRPDTPEPREAAAPDLLAACQAFVDWYNVDSSEQKRDDAFYLAQSAITKATKPL